MKEYRVNDREYFNLNSMYDKLWVRQKEKEERGEWDERLEAKIDRLEWLIDRSRSRLVPWSILEEIREISITREILRAV